MNNTDFFRFRKADLSFLKQITNKMKAVNVQVPQERS